jgi:4-methylaminobutanoate oxidase (formaldehyde-forming)
MAHWITTGRPDVDVTGFNVDRFRPWQADDGYRAARTTEILGTVYAAHTPGKQLRSARDVLLSPVHDRLVSQGGWMREVSGWEGADWFAGPGVTPTAEPTWGRAPWFAQWEAEHRAVREGVGLMDMSFMAKFRVTGSDAGAVLDRVSAGLVDGPAETITYTQWLDEDGRIEADLTVTKLADDDFLVVASDTAHGHALAWLGRAVGSADVRVEDVTEDYAQLNVQGPRSREVLAALTEADLSTEVFPFRTARWIDVAGVQVLCARITYLGELGYELYVPAQDGLKVYDALQSVGAAYGLVPVGLKALSSLRMEKGYRDFGHDIDNTDCPLEVGLGFALALDKPGGFVGREAVLARRSANQEAGGMGQRLVGLRVLDPAPLLFHAEVVLRDGVEVGYVRAASYGWTLGSAVGLAFVSGGGSPVTAAWLAEGTWEVDVAGARYPVEMSLKPLYDPTSARVRG